MAAALQNEMKDSMTVVATTTLVAFDRAGMVKSGLLVRPAGQDNFPNLPARLAEGLKIPGPNRGLRHWNSYPPPHGCVRRFHPSMKKSAARRATGSALNLCG